MSKSMEEIKWWHQVPLNDGRITPGRVPIYQHEGTYLFNEVDFAGKSVLDIGAWDGYFSFSAEKRGASRVVAFDNPDFRWGGLDGFNFLHDHFKSSVEWKKGTIYQLPQEVFDVVLCYGVLYHLSDPLLAITNCFQRSRELVLIEGLITDEPEPKLTLLEPMFGNDHSNIYTMSTGYLTMIARLNGFELIKSARAASHRGAMIFKADAPKVFPYKGSCFPFLPANSPSSNMDTPEIEAGASLDRLPEFIKAAYLSLLGNLPEGKPARANKVAETEGLDAFFSDITDSVAFRNRQFKRFAPDLVRAVCQALLGREAEPAEMAAMTGSLEGAGNLSTLLSQLTESDEYKGSVFISFVPELLHATYSALLGREPDLEGGRAYSAFLAERRDLTTFFLDITRSPEFKEKHLGKLAASQTNGDSQLDAVSDAVNRDDKIAKEGEEGHEALSFDEEALDRPLTRDMTRAAFSLLLGRPASEMDVSSHLSAKTGRTLRTILLRSEEFQQRFMEFSKAKPPAFADIQAPKTIFLHIPKTGGSTMRQLLKPHFAPGQVCPEHFDGLHCYRSAELAQFRLFAGHFPLPSCELIPGPKRIFTMLRRPADRLISLYNFGRSHSEVATRRDELHWARLARQYSMRQFFSLDKIRRSPMMNNAVVRLLSMSPLGGSRDVSARIESDLSALDLLDAARNSLRDLHSFGLLERYEESVDLIFHALGLEVPSKIIPENMLAEIAGKTPDIERIELEECDSETMEIISSLVEADTALYDHGVNLFESNLKILHSAKA